MWRFMDCPDRPLEPPDDDTPENRRYWALVEEKEALEERIFRIDCELEDLDFPTVPVFTLRLLEQIRKIADKCADPQTQEKLDDLHDAIKYGPVQPKKQADFGIPVDPISGYVPL